jgi:hypothetical protein
VATHYDTLGVRPDATAGELRAAYLARARALHPDRHASATPDQRARAERAMQSVNAAWSVVGEPQRRRAYDLSISRAVGTPAAGGTAQAAPARVDHVEGPDDDREDVGPLLAHLVRLAPVLLLLATLGAIFVVTAFATGTGSVDIPPRPTVSAATPPVGSCVRVGTTLTRVRCGGPHDAVVQAIVTNRGACPAATVPFAVEHTDVVCLAAP